MGPSPCDAAQSLWNPLTRSPLVQMLPQRKVQLYTVHLRRLILCFLADVTDLNRYSVINIVNIQQNVNFYRGMLRANFQCRAFGSEFGGGWQERVSMEYWGDYWFYWNFRYCLRIEFYFYYKDRQSSALFAKEHFGCLCNIILFILYNFWVIKLFYANRIFYIISQD